MHNRSSFIIFMIAFLGVLGFVNMVTYKSILFLFPTQSDLYQVIIGGALIFLTLGFIASMFIGMKFYNRITRILHTLTSLWMGALVYFFFSSVLIGIAALCRFDITTLKLVGIILYGGSALLSIYGIIHARSIMINHVSVSLTNLPEQWNTKTLVWISDVHLGQVYGKSFSEKIVAIVQSQNPDIVIIGGDLFDGTKAPPLHDLVAPFQILKIPQGIFFISGNHEEFGDASVFFEVIQNVGIKILKDESITIDGVQLIGVDYHNTVDRDQFAKILSREVIGPLTPSILLKHEPRNLDIAERAGISFSISGHTHYGQQFPFGLLASSIYKGYAYGLKSLNNMSVYVSSGVGSWGPALRIGSNSEIVVFHFSQKKA